MDRFVNSGWFFCEDDYQNPSEGCGANPKYVILKVNCVDSIKLVFRKRTVGRVFSVVVDSPLWHVTMA